MSTAPVTNVLLDPSGSPYDSVQVTATLFPAIQVFGPDSHEVGLIAHTATDPTGHWTLPLERTDTMNLAGMAYIVTETPRGEQPITSFIDVPSAAGGTLEALQTSRPSPPLPLVNPTVNNLTVTGNASVAGTLSVTGPLSAEVLDTGGAEYNGDALGMVGDGTTDNTTALNALLATMYTDKGGTIVLRGKNYLVSGRIVFPNSTGGSFIGAIGSAAPTQPFYRIRGTASNPTGQAGTQLLLPYASPHPSSATVSGPFAAGATTFTGLTIPQGSFDVGSLLTVNDGTRQETAVVTAIVIGGGNITSATVTLVLTYAAGTNNVTLSWPITDDAKIVSLGSGVLVLEDITPIDTSTNNVTPFLLLTHTKPIFHRVNLTGWRGPAVYPGAIHTNQWPTQDGIVLGGARAQSDGSPSSCFTGYTGEITGGLMNNLRTPWVTQGAFTTTRFVSNYVNSTCGSPSHLGAAFETHTSFPTSNNSVTLADNQLELTHYQQVVRLGTGSNSFTLSDNQMPDNVIATVTAASAAIGDTTLSVVGYLPPVTMAPYLQSYRYALDRGSYMELVRFASINTGAHTTTMSAAAAGATTIVVASATGIAAGTNLLLDPGTYGGAPGATGVQEPAIVAASYVSGLTIPLTRPLVYAHNAAAGVQVGPWLATLQVALVQAHAGGVTLSPNISGVRIESGSTKHVISMGACDSPVGVRDLNATPSSTILEANQTTGSAAGSPTVFATPVQFPQGLYQPVSPADFGSSLLQIGGATTRSPAYLMSNHAGQWLDGLTWNGYYAGANTWVYAGSSTNHGGAAVLVRDNGQIVFQTSADVTASAPVTAGSFSNAGLFTALFGLTVTGPVTVTSSTASSWTASNTIGILGTTAQAYGFGLFQSMSAAGSQTGLYLNPTKASGSGGLNALRAGADVAAAATPISINQGYFPAPSVGAGGTIGTVTGVLIDPMVNTPAGSSATGGWAARGMTVSVPSQGGNTTGTNTNIGILLLGNGGTASGGTVANWGIFSNSTAPSSHLGSLAIGKNTAPAVPLDVVGAGTFTGLVTASLGLTVTGAVSQFANASSATAANPTALHNSTDTITGAVTDGYTGALRLSPTINAATAQTVTRHNYLDLNNPVLGGAGPAAVTDAAVFRFDAAPGTHKALASNGAVATVLGSLGPTGAQTTVQGWLKINVNGTMRYLPFF